MECQVSWTKNLETHFIRGGFFLLWALLCDGLKIINFDCSFYSNSSRCLLFILSLNWIRIIRVVWIYYNMILPMCPPSQMEGCLCLIFMCWSRAPFLNAQLTTILQCKKLNMSQPYKTTWNPHWHVDSMPFRAIPCGQKYMVFDETLIYLWPKLWWYQLGWKKNTNDYSIL
jgi:hypothetical protein